MAVAAKDQSGASTLIGVSSVDLVTPVRVRVDPITGYLLASVKVIAAYTGTNPSVKFDQSSTRVGRGVTADSNKTIKPFLSDPNNPGRIVCQL